MWKDKYNIYRHSNVPGGKKTVFTFFAATCERRKGEIIYTYLILNQMFKIYNCSYVVKKCNYTPVTDLQQNKLRL